MKTEDYNKLGEFERMIYDYLLAAFNENKYTIELDGEIFEIDGYVSGNVNFGGVKLRCSINQKGYICWHCDKMFVSLLEAIPHLVRKIVAQTKRIIRDTEVEWRKRRISELQEELDNLKNQ